MPPERTPEGLKSLVPRGVKPPKETRSLSKALVPRSARSSEPHPSTSRALVLRRAAYGSGELALSRKVSGQEKLSLLAEEMMTSAIRAPFHIDGIFRMAESQLALHLDEISNLKDPVFFYDDVMATIDSRMESTPDDKGRRRPPIDDLHWVALAVGCRIHNVYLLAGSWRIIRDLLKELGHMGLDDNDVRGQLRMNEKMRAKYLLLYDIVTTVARMGQQRVANLTAASAHYKGYFVPKNKMGPGEPDMEFDHHGNNPRKIREAHKSYIDAILLELVLPDSRYPPYVLMACLHDAVEECRREEKRFTQALWDSVGDLSIIVQVLDLLEGPLLSPESEAWVQDTEYMRREYKAFLTAQTVSAQACTMVDSWEPYLRPLIDTKKPSVLAQLWDCINRSYQQASGVSVDNLWSLQNELQRPPQWSTFHLPGLNIRDGSDPDSRALTLHKNAKRHQGGHSSKGMRQITQGSCSDSDDMPPLMSASDSSEDGGKYDSESEHQRSEGDAESDYDADEDELLQEMLQEALDAVIDMDDFLEQPDIKKSSNPFTRMLSNLKDRYFSANPTLKANEQSRRPFKPRPENVTSSPAVPRPATKATTQTNQDCHRDLPSLESTGPLQPEAKPAQTKTGLRTTSLKLESGEEKLPSLVTAVAAASEKSQKTTIEVVEDEDDEDKSRKKRKKKKKKKKVQEVSVPLSPPPALQQPISAVPAVSTPPQGDKGCPAKQSQSASFLNLRDGLEEKSPRASLHLTRDTTAQSSRSYLQSENLNTERTKVKTRPAFAGSFFRSDNDSRKVGEGEKEKKGLLGRMKKPIFRLPKRAGDLMSRLISPADGKTHAKKTMKWEEFLKVMRLMGFSYDPSTAGSSVRFDPPDPNDQSITFHKPHPDPTLQRNHLREFGKRLKKAYGWSYEQFDNFGVGQDDDDDN